MWLAAPAVIAVGLFVLRSVAATFVLFYIGVCILIPFTDLVVLGKRKTGETLTSLGFRNLKKNISPALVTGTVVGVLVVLFFTLLQKEIMDIGSVRATLARWNVGGNHLFWFVLTMVLANSVVEEFYWRGYILSRLMERGNGPGAVILSSLFYASYHVLTTGALFSLKYAAICTFSIFTAGLAWGFIRLRTGSLWVPVITHLFADLGIMIVFLKYFS